ncbi:MAG: DinB family protein [Saprospiraceae bacterium]
MHLRQYVHDTFDFNRHTNLKLLRKIGQLSQPAESIRHFSHLINSQEKWLARILQDPRAPDLSWWEPVYPYQELANRWVQSVDKWQKYLDRLTDEALLSEVTFVGFDGGHWAATPLDIALQLNYHSIHHRAQIQMLIRQQGLEPDFVDYIGTRYRKVSD